MSQFMRVTTLVGNTARGRDMLAEHGLAFWIEIGPKRVLFDTGQGKVLQSNASRLGALPRFVDAIALSHGHYDHSGGFMQSVRLAWRAKVYAHPGVFQPKYARDADGTVREIGMPFSDESAVRQKADDLIWTVRPTAIVEGLAVTGEIPRETELENGSGPFFLDRDCRKPDRLIDDQAMFFASSHGSVVLLGCAHAGVINTLQYIRLLTGDKPIDAVIGGMHLGGASPERVDRTIEAFRQLDVQRLYPAHCTGMAAMVQLWSAFPERCFACTVGTTMEFEGA